MRKNMGSTDNILRVLGAILIAVLYFSNVINVAFAIILGAIVLLFVSTSFISFCPLYFPFGFSTRNKV